MSRTKKIAIVTRNKSLSGAQSLLSVKLPTGWESNVVEVEDPNYKLLRESEIVFTRLSSKTQERVIRLLGENTDSSKQLVSPSKEGIATSFNKCLSQMKFEESSLPTPGTQIFMGGTTISSIGIKGPWVIKPALESQGNGVVRVDTEEDLLRVSRQYAHTYGDYLVQEYIEARGTDRRLFMLGDSVLAAIERRAKDGDFRSNLSKGGSGLSYSPTSEEVSMAATAIKSLGLDFGGVDILPSSSRPLLLEADASPGYQIGAITGVNVQAALLNYLITLYSTLYD